MNCLSHDWLSPRHVIVATERGKIIIFEDAELKSSYSLEELTKTEDTELLEKEDSQLMLMLMASELSKFLTCVQNSAATID